MDQLVHPVLKDKLFPRRLFGTHRKRILWLLPLWVLGPSFTVVVAGVSAPNKMFFNSSWLPYSSTQSEHHLLRGSVRFHRLMAQSYETVPVLCHPSFSHQSQAQASTDWLQTRVPVDLLPCRMPIASPAGHLYF